MMGFLLVLEANGGGMMSFSGQNRPEADQLWHIDAHFEENQA